MNQRTQLNQPTFRALNGLEAAEYIARRVSSVVPDEASSLVREYVLDACKRSGRFENSASYPVALVRFRSAGIIVKVLPSMTLPRPFVLPLNIDLGDVRIIGLDKGVGVRTSDGDTFHEMNCDIGVLVENAPDKIRELIGEPVLVPQKIGERVVNLPKEFQVSKAGLLSKGE